MTLKESFQYMNYLKSLVNQANGELYEQQFCTKTVETHMKDANNPEVIEVKKNTDIKPMDLVNLTMDIIGEIDGLESAISEAKSGSGFDELVYVNSQKRLFLDSLEKMLEYKTVENKRQGISYIINANGDQTPFKYDVISVTSIDFDRNQIRGLVRKLRDETAKNSLRIDELQLINVDYIPKYSIGDSFSDILES